MQRKSEGLPDAATIEIIGSAAFQQLFWETLRDDESGLEAAPLSIRAEIIRRPVASQTFGEETRFVPYTAPSLSDNYGAGMLERPLNVLLVVARPRGLRDEGLRSISSVVVAALRSEPPQRTLEARIDVVRPGTFKKLQTTLQDAARQERRYDIVHFDMHGKISKSGNV